MLNILRDKKARDNALQACALALVVMIVTALGITTYNNLTEQGITSGFGFLERSTGWDIPFALLDYSIRDPYWRVLLIGFLNTLFIGVISLAFATVFGALIGIARISANPLLRFLGSVYVEIFRNIPLILQAFFWYAMAMHLPPPRRAFEWEEAVFLSSRGIYMPALNVAPWFYATVVLVAVSAVTGAVIWRRRARAAGRTVNTAYLLAGCAGVFAVMAAGLLIVAVPTGETLLEYPVLKGLRFDGGMHVIPEFYALALSIIAFGSAYIGEIVRGGFNAVERGQLDSAKALGLKPWMILLHVHLPLALRAIVPPLGNMYVWLMKATTLGIAIGFSDLFMIVSTSINQSGQTIELLALMMTGFFIINYSISLLMNLLNRAIALKGYEVHRRTGAEL
ncbi:MAG: ABC transporter permease subunit [Gammaproteobacteria bacterium]|nr:ABC transporter permease subunit [Gammaproteobacteria bacterium]